MAPRLTHSACHLQQVVSRVWNYTIAVGAPMTFGPDRGAGCVYVYYYRYVPIGCDPSPTCVFNR